MIQISHHPQGMRVRLPKETQLSAPRLRQLLQVPVTRLPRGEVAVPVQSAYLLLQHFPPGTATWDDVALDIAMEQAARRSAQLRAQVEVAYAIENARQVLADYPLADKLDDHQAEAVAAIAAPSLQGIAIFDEQGTGKTIMALSGYDWLRQLDIVDRLLVIAPKSVVGSWLQDAGMLFGDRHHLQIVGGSSRQRRDQILSDPSILVMSYETAAAEQSLLSAVLSPRSRRYMLVVDESYYVKNPDAHRTKAVVALRAYCERAVVLCGTPAPNRPHDIVQQITIADEGVTFDRLVISDDRSAAYSTIAEALNDAIYLRRLKTDVLPDIPDKQIERVLFNLQPMQRSMYDYVARELALAIRTVDDAQFIRQLPSFLARRATLLQLCSHPGVLDPLYAEVPAKQLVLDQLLAELIEHRSEKVVLWSYYRYSLQALAARYAHYGVVRIDGSVPSVDARLTAIHSFQHDPRVKLFLGNAAAAGAGITLTAARHAIYESFSDQAAHYMQSVDRIHRRGQVYDVMYHILLARDTLEPHAFARILEKERAGRQLLGDVYSDPPTRERFLAELEGLGV